MRRDRQFGVVKLKSIVVPQLRKADEFRVLDLGVGDGAKWSSLHRLLRCLANQESGAFDGNDSCCTFRRNLLHKDTVEELLLRLAKSSIILQFHTAITSDLDT